jgi:hypothetical protein
MSVEYVLAMQLKVGLVMSVIDRLRSRVDAISRGPLSKRVDTIAACGVVLTDLSFRRQYALAYRAAVDAAYTEAALDVNPTARGRAQSNPSGRGSATGRHAESARLAKLRAQLSGT